MPNKYFICINEIEKARFILETVGRNCRVQYLDIGAFFWTKRRERLIFWRWRWRWLECKNNQKP